MSADPIDWLKGFIRSEEPAEGPPPVGPPRRFGKYEVLSEIGRGATSIVYKARDPDLRRPVALKVLREEHLQPVRVERFHREATAAAKLRHPNIVSVHEVGTILGKEGGVVHFIAMDYVEGLNLAEAAAQMRPDERLRILLAVARTVGFAHEQGVIHRDLKPENILVERSSTEDGSGLPWRVWLTDFGLAKVVGDEDLTRSGTVLGTPHYMSPEQVRGRSRETGPAADVWALGVMAYACVSGRWPFDGPSAFDLYQSIVGREPHPLRGTSGLRSDLETIIFKALEKDPAARYPDGAAFARDLDLCLRDEPIGTRRPGLVRKGWRRIRKNPLLYGLGAGLAGVLAVALALGATWRAERRKSVEEFRGQFQVAVDAALALRRAGANAKMRRLLPQLEEAYRNASSRAPGRAELDHLMGRMYRALMEDERALERQEAALRKDPAYAPALYERAVLTFKKYAQAFERAGGEDSASGGGGGASAAADLLRKAVIRDCAALVQESRGRLPPVQELVARGMLACAGGRVGDARALLEEASRTDPLLDEVWLVLGHAARLETASTFEGRERRYRSQEASYTQALARDHGFVPHLVRRGRVRISLGRFYGEHGRDPAAELAAAEADLTEALAKEPSSFEALLDRATGRLYRSLYGRSSATDPLADLRAAEADLDALTAGPAHPQLSVAWRMKGRVQHERGNRLGGSGRDPLRDYAAARASFVRARERARDRVDKAESDAFLARMLADWGAYADGTNQDPSALFEEAERAFARALEVMPANPWYLRWRATALVLRAGTRAARAEAPFADYALAEEDLGQVIRMQRDMTSAWCERARLRFDRGGAWEDRQGRDRAREDYAAAAHDYLEALSLNPLLQAELGPRMALAQMKAADPDE